MIPDLDIYRSANVFIREYGEDAAIEAAQTGVPQCSKWPLSRASDRKISPMKKEIAMQTTESWTNLRATATGATVFGNWRSHLGNLGE